LDDANIIFAESAQSIAIPARHPLFRDGIIHVVLMGAEEQMVQS